MKVFAKPVYLAQATRTPIGKFGGGLKSKSAPELASLALREAMGRRKAQCGDEGHSIDAVFLGHARQAGTGPNPARQAGILAGLAETIPAVTFNQACASGLASIIAAVEKIQTGKAHTLWAGGTESMSNTPYLLPNARWGQRLGHTEAIDGMRKDGFFCPMASMLMGETVDSILVPEFSISREDQDAFALESQIRAANAWKAGLFSDETFAIEAILVDEHVRGDTTAASLAKLAPVFSKSGTVTAGNSSGITDGAAFVCVTDQPHASNQAELLDYEIIAIDPKRMGLGPIAATERLLKRQGLAIDDLEAIELNEAFAAQAIACQRALNIPHEKLNAWGGAIALGHPIGATGTRIVTTLLHRLKSKPGSLGLATLCVSGGMGVSVLVRSLW